MAALVLGAATPVMAQPIGDAEMAAQLRFQAGRHAYQRPLQTLAGDVTCDGVEDRVVGWTDLDHPDGPFFVVMVVTRRAGAATSELAYFGFGGRTQADLCLAAEGPPPGMAFERLAPAEAAEIAGAKVCGLAIRIDGGECDSPRLFWLPEGAADGHLLMHRN